MMIETSVKRQTVRKDNVYKISETNLRWYIEQVAGASGTPRFNDEKERDRETHTSQPEAAWPGDWGRAPGTRYCCSGCLNAANWLIDSGRIFCNNRTRTHTCRVYHAIHDVLTNHNCWRERVLAFYSLYTGPRLTTIISIFRQIHLNSVNIKFSIRNNRSNF